MEVARKILETVARPFVLRDGSYTVTASIGIATYPQDGRDAPELLKNADIAMYRAKEQGKNNFQVPLRRNEHAPRRAREHRSARCGVALERRSSRSSTSRG